MPDWKAITPDQIDVEPLAQAIRDAAHPLRLNSLARVAAQDLVQAEAQVRYWAPGASYSRGETICINGQTALLENVQDESNPKQGPFQILTLVFPDGTHRLLAAAVPKEPADDQPSLPPKMLEAILGGDIGLIIRTTVGKALRNDDRFVWYQDSQADHWCLDDMLPTVTTDAWSRIYDQLPDQLKDGKPASRTTEELVVAAWRAGDDGGDTYALRAFALGRILSECTDVVALHDRWTSQAAWQAFSDRGVLTSPAQPTQIEIPPEVQEATQAEIEQESTREIGTEVGEEPATGDEEAPEITEDLESWRLNHPTQAVFTLSARHYHENWLPLTARVRRLFPPLAAQRQEVRFHHQFGGVPEYFRAFVDWGSRRILVSTEMYDTFRTHAIHPGARLNLAARDEQNYELATRLPRKSEDVRVWRMWLEDGEIQYAFEHEPRTYDIDDDVYIADVRFEDRDALFQQADEAANSIFGLMYCRSVDLWRAGDCQDLIVTGDQLFNEVHFDRYGRMTTKVTIAWELWRRLAFKSIGGGNHLFRPQFGARTYHLTLPRTPSRPSTRPPRAPSRPPISLQQLAQGASPVVTSTDLWAALQADDQKLAALHAAIKNYLGDPARERVLFLREKAHQNIRRLLSPEHLASLSLAEFNTEVWQAGNIGHKGHRIDSEETQSFLTSLSMEELRSAYKSGDLSVQGNQTWGSGAYKYGTRLDAADAEKEQILRRTLRYLLYGSGPIEQRMQNVINESNGFGINSVSGIVHAVFPGEQILYNQRSLDALAALALLSSPPTDWPLNVRTYLAYRPFCQEFRRHFGFHSLTDVDWFMYNLATQRLVLEEPSLAADEAFLTRTSLLSPETQPTLKPSPAPAYFIFQQRPGANYADRAGEIYNWRDGIPGSKQIKVDARFIYYRPGERLFFGAGRVSSIEQYTAEDGNQYCNGHVADHEPWDPPLALTPDLASKISFVRPEFLSVGQAGIRKISQEDFDAILEAQRQQLQARTTPPTSPESSTAATLPPRVDATHPARVVTPAPVDAPSLVKPGDLDFLDQSRKLSQHMQPVAERLLTEVRTWYNGELEYRAATNFYKETPINFWTVQIQTTKDRLRITISGKPDQYDSDVFDLKLNFRVYTLFYLEAEEQLSEAVRLIKESATRKNAIAITTQATSGLPRAPANIIITTDPVRDLWAELQGDSQRLALLENAVQAHLADPYREHALFFRAVAHQKIRDLLHQDRLANLTLDQFNHEIWQIGSLHYRGRKYRWPTESGGVPDLCKEINLAEFQDAYNSGQLTIVGNHNWGSGTGIIGPGLGKSDQEMQRIVRDTLQFLLYGSGPVEDRMNTVIKESNGFGMNSVTGILHAVYPTAHILYNKRSTDALRSLGFAWSDLWHIKRYIAFKALCDHLQQRFLFKDYTDVDLFIYTHEHHRNSPLYGT